MAKNLSSRTHFFLRSFWKYLIIIMIPILAVEPFTLYRTWEQIESTVEAENRRLLYQAENRMEEMRRNAGSISSYLSQNVQVEYAARNILRRGIMELDMKDSLEMIMRYLQNTQNTDDSIYSIYVYCENDFGRFFDSRSGIQTMQNFYDTKWVGDYLAMKQDVQYSRHEIRQYDFADPVPVVTVYRKLYLGSAEEPVEGVVAVNYRADSVADYLQGISQHENQSIAFVDAEGEVLVQCGDISLQPILKEAGGALENRQEIEKKEIRLDGRLYVMTVMQPGDTQISCLSLVPYTELYQQIFLLLRIILLSMLAAFLISLFLAWVSARKEVNNLHTIISLLNHETEPGKIQKNLGKRKRNLYDYILFNLLQMFMEQDYLKMQYSERKYRMELLNLQALQQQINPHFMNNTLNGIYWESIRMSGGPNACSGMVEKLSSIMKYALEYSVQEAELFREITYLHNYTDIQNARYGNRILVDWKIETDTEQIRILKMLLQPLLENAIYHGIKEKDFNGAIRIRTRLKEGYLQIRVIDTGAGVSREKEKEIRIRLKDSGGTDDHIGLFNTGRRLVLRYGEGAGIRFRSIYGVGTCVSFFIPV